MEIEAVKIAIRESDIVGIIGQYVSLKKSGNNWVGLCPFHKEKTPSFNVSEKKKIYKCFGCGKSGDVVNFLREHKNYSFNDAIKEIGILDSDSLQLKQMKAPLPAPPKVLHFIDPKFLKSSLQDYENNCFVTFLLTVFDREIVNELTTKIYYVGTSKSFWNGATAFWQVDGNLGVRQVKIILYNPSTGNRRKWKIEADQNLLSSTSQQWIIDRKMDMVQWGKQLIKKTGVKEPSIIKCFFGEHLLSRFPDMKVAIVESEKTAILMTGFSEIGLPIAEDYIWLATGGANGIDFTNYNSIKVLEDREVVLFPDLEKYEDWAIAAASIEGVKIEVSDLLENIATDEEREKGEDIADYFLREYLAGNFNEVIEAPNIISRYDQIFNDFNSKNPMVGELIGIFDLDAKKSRTDQNLNLNKKNNLVKTPKLRSSKCFSPEEWEQQLYILIPFFRSFFLPYPNEIMPDKISIKKGFTIPDVQKFIGINLSIVLYESNKGNPNVQQHLQYLINLKEYLIKVYESKKHIIDS